MFKLLALWLVLLVVIGGFFYFAKPLLDTGNELKALGLNGNSSGTNGPSGGTNNAGAGANNAGAGSGARKSVDVSWDEKKREAHMTERLGALLILGLLGWGIAREIGKIRP